MRKLSYHLSIMFVVPFLICIVSTSILQAQFLKEKLLDMTYPFDENTVFICKGLTCSVPLKNGTEIDMYLHHQSE